jgi:hypothetical protein
VFPVNIIPPVLHIDLQLQVAVTSRAKGEAWDLPKEMFFRKLGVLDIKVLSRSLCFVPKQMWDGSQNCNLLLHVPHAALPISIFRNWSSMNQKSKFFALYFIHRFNFNFHAIPIRRTSRRGLGTF